MSSKFAIMRHVKVKSADQHNALYAHNFREIFTKNIDQKRTHKNIVLTPIKYRNFDDFVQTKKTEIREGNKKRDDGEKKSRFPRTVVNKKTKEKELLALSQEFVFTHSPGALSEDQSILYLKDADQFIRNWFEGRCEVLSSLIHLDEKTPHVHVHVAYYDEGDCRFIQKELSNKGLTDVNQIREAFQNEVAAKYGLVKQDGSVVAKGKHQDKASLEVSRLKEQNKDLSSELRFEQSINAVAPQPQQSNKVAELEQQIEEIKDDTVRRRVTQQDRRAEREAQRRDERSHRLNRAAAAITDEDYRAIKESTEQRAEQEQTRGAVKAVIQGACEFAYSQSSQFLGRLTRELAELGNEVLEDIGMVLTIKSQKADRVKMRDQSVSNFAENAI